MRVKTLPALSERRRRLVEENIGLAKSIALRWAGSLGKDDMDELIAVALLALTRAAARYDDRGVPFPSYAYLAVRGPVAHAARRLRRPPEYAFGGLAGRDVAIEEAEEPVGDPGDIPGWLGRLEPRERTAVELHFGLADGVARHFGEVAAEMQYHSKQRAHQVFQSAMAKLRRWAAADARDSPATRD